MTPSSSQRLLTIPFAIPACRTPDEALAVVELLDDLRQLIWAHYGMSLPDWCCSRASSITCSQPDTTRT
jgi:hypothetical protein